MAMGATETVIALRDSLARLHDEAMQFVHDQGVDPMDGSIAATERATFPRPESLYSAATIGTMLLESVGEHVTTFIKTVTEPIEPIACWTCVRSMLESASIAAWLLDPRIDAVERVGRTFSYRYEGQEQQAKFGRAMGHSPAD